MAAVGLDPSLPRVRAAGYLECACLTSLTLTLCDFNPNSNSAASLHQLTRDPERRRDWLREPCSPSGFCGSKTIVGCRRSRGPRKNTTGICPLRYEHRQTRSTCSPPSEKAQPRPARTSHGKSRRDCLYDILEKPLETLAPFSGRERSECDRPTRIAGAAARLQGRDERGESGASSRPWRASNP